MLPSRLFVSGIAYPSWSTAKTGRWLASSAFSVKSYGGDAAGLTGWNKQVRIEVGMRKLLRRTFRPIGWALTVVLAVALSADCVASAEMTEAQKACCAAMGHDCGRMAQAQDCCSHEAPEIEKFSAVKPSPLSPPVALVAPVVYLPGVSHSGRISSFRALISVAQKLPGVPTYLSNSTFRI